MEAKSMPKLHENGPYYPAFKSGDARFDGRVFMGVSSTGIYCRPVCRAKMPKEENCTFYNSATAAEAAGYRPCLLCRPELAPGYAPVDASSRLAKRAAFLMDENYHYESSLQTLAGALNISARHLRRVFTAEYGVPPIQYLQTNRLLLAKSMLTDTNLSITDIAFAAGFGSIRQFNALFKERYRMPPSALRKQRESAIPPGQDSVTLYLGYRPPYLWADILAFLEARAIAGVEAVMGGVYARTAAVSHNAKLYRGWIAVRQWKKSNTLAVTLSASLLPVTSLVMARIKYLFDLYCDPEEIYNSLSIMNQMKTDICVKGIRLPGSFDPFELSVRAILGQQITVKAAQTLAGRIAAAYGTALETPIKGLTHTFPGPVDFYDMGGAIEGHLGVLGVTRARARSIRALAAGIVNGTIELSRNTDPHKQMNKLLALPGFGPWTVQYIAMRGLGWPDAFPHTDYGVKKALAGYSPGEIRKYAEQWAPWRSYATICLWRSL